MRALTLNVDGGNHVPTDVAPSREVNADGHQLRLGAISLGAPREDATLQGAISPLTPDAPFALTSFPPDSGARRVSEEPGYGDLGRWRSSFSE